MTDLTAARDEFAIRYYRWSQEDFRREVRGDFALLRAVRDRLAMRTVHYLESLPDAERLRLAMALVKRNHKRAIDILGEPATAEDQALVETYRVMGRNPGAEEEDSHVDSSRFLAIVKDALRRSLGDGEPFSTSHEWKFTTPIGPWRLVTFIDSGGAKSHPTYTQTIRIDERLVLKEGISILGWLGIGGGHTTWNRVTESETEAAAASLAAVCEHFARAAPALVDGVQI